MSTCCEGGLGKHLGDFCRAVHFRWKVGSTISALGLQNGACSTGGKRVIRFNRILITNWFIFKGVQKLGIMIW